MKVKKNIAQCVLLCSLGFSFYALGFLFLQPMGEWKGLFLLLLVLFFNFIFHEVVLLLGLRARKLSYKWSPISKLYTSNVISSEFVAMRSMKGNILLVFRSDLSTLRQKEIHEYFLNHPRKAFAWTDLWIASLFFLITQPILSILRRTGTLRPFLLEFFYFFANPCVELALGKRSYGNKRRKSKVNLCEEILCRASINSGDALFYRALKKSL